VDTNGIDWWDHADWADAKFTCGSGGALLAQSSPFSGMI
jgi:hypothetical protein